MEGNVVRVPENAVLLGTIAAGAPERQFDLAMREVLRSYRGDKKDSSAKREITIKVVIQQSQGMLTFGVSTSVKLPGSKSAVGVASISTDGVLENMTPPKQLDMLGAANPEGEKREPLRLVVGGPDDDTDE